jgi:hypothetical protein
VAGLLSRKADRPLGRKAHNTQLIAMLPYVVINAGANALRPLALEREDMLIGFVSQYDSANLRAFD